MNMQTLKQDYDTYGHPELRDEGELLELVKIDIQRIFHLLGPRAGKVAVIKRSSHGFHVNYPFAKITKEENCWLLENSPLDSGYRYWAIERGCTTLRISDKIIVKEVGEKPWSKRFVGCRVVKDVPFVVETIRNPYM